MRIPEASKHRVGRRLVDLADALNITQTAMAQRLHVPSSRLRNYTSGVSLLPVEIAVRLCRTYGVTLEWVYLGQIDRVEFELAQKLVALEGRTLE